MCSLYILDEQLKPSIEPCCYDKPKRGRPPATTNSRVVPELGTGTNGGVVKFVPIIVAAAAATPAAATTALTSNACRMSTGTDRRNTPGTERVYHEHGAHTEAICEGSCPQQMGGAHSSDNIGTTSKLLDAERERHKKWEEDFNAEAEKMYEERYGKSEGTASAPSKKRGRKQNKEKNACGGASGGATLEVKEGAEGKPKRKCPKYKIRITNGGTTSDSGASGGDTATSGGDTSDADARYAAEFGEPASSAN